MEHLGVKKELGKVKSTKMSYFGHVVRKHNTLEKEVKKSEKLSKAQNPIKPSGLGFLKNLGFSEPCL